VKWDAHPQPTFLEVRPLHPVITCIHVSRLSHNPPLTYLINFSFTVNFVGFKIIFWGPLSPSNAILFNARWNVTRTLFEIRSSLLLCYSVTV